MIGAIGRVMTLPPSRRRQWLRLQIDRLRTRLIHARRLRSCGARSIVQRPLFWTPEFIQLGERVLIWEGCRIEGIHEYGGRAFVPLVSIGDGASLQQNCHVIAASRLSIGRDTTISSGVFISDCDHAYETIGVNVLEQPLLVDQTSIGEGCFVGAGARILAGTRLGNHCVVGSNAVVRGSFPDYSVIVGAGRIVRRYDASRSKWVRTLPDGRLESEAA